MEPITDARRTFSRRMFLRDAARVGAGCIAAGAVAGGCTALPPPAEPATGADRGAGFGPPAGADRWCLVSDLHLAGDPRYRCGGVAMAARARAAMAEVLAGDAAPAGVVVAGDCAFHCGNAPDYDTFGDVVLRPADARQVPVHVTLGNHDHRGHFLQTAGRGRGFDRPPLGRCAAVVESDRADLILLDSLDPECGVSGRLGRRQLDWLDDALAARRDRPAVLVAHHPVDPEPEPVVLLGSSGLADADDFWAVVRRHPRVKAFAFGHTHRWEVKQKDGVHLVNLPTTGYVFDPRQPAGWVEMWVGDDGAWVRLRRFGTTTAEPADAYALPWA